MTSLITGGSLIEGGFQSEGAPPGVGNLEAVILRPNGGAFSLWHYWRDQGSPDRSWNLGSVITPAAIGPGAICQRRNRGNVAGNFEVVVPVAEGLAHLLLDSSVPAARPWHRVGIATPGSIGPGAVLENRMNENLEVVVLHGRALVHHRFDGAEWHAGAAITDRASGPPAMIQSDYNNQLEVLVPEGDRLSLYVLGNSATGATWRWGGLVASAGDGPVGFVQGRYGADPHRNFEALVPHGDLLAHHWRDNMLADRPWKPGIPATWGAGQVRAAALCSSNLGDGWLQALTQEGTSIYHLYRYRVGEDFRWMRSACLRLDDATEVDMDLDRARSVKLAQITGEPDAQTGGATLAMSRSRSGIHGTDLGVTVKHGDRTFLLFGDTHWDDGDRATLDAIGEVRGATEALPDVVLHGAPLEIVGGPVTQREFDVPLDAFSEAGHLFAFFTSDHFVDGKVMGRSVLTRAVDSAMPISGDERDRPLRFQLLTTFSTYRLINVSVQLRPASAVPGFGQDGRVLLVWGSGAYRADDLSLAVLDLRDAAARSHLFEDRPFPVAALGPRYFAGMERDAPVWSSHEEEARPVLFPCALGELSVRWVNEIDRYVLLAMSGPEEPVGANVWLRTAAAPWGPWSRRRQVFDWIRDGMGFRDRSKQFIHFRDANPPDTVGDCIFPQQCDSGGAAYAPYLFDVDVQGDNVQIRYTLSTWNPYQSMLMRHDVTMAELSAL
jgi:hypothetical protein